MTSNIFVNLPVVDITRSVSFFSKLGYGFNEQFTDENVAAMVVNDNIYVIMLNHDKFSQFTSKPVANAHDSTESVIALSAESRQAVDVKLSAALSNGAVEARRAQDHGWMYGRSFHDLDGHIWEYMWIDSDYIK